MCVLVLLLCAEWNGANVLVQIIWTVFQNSDCAIDQLIISGCDAGKRARAGRNEELEFNANVFVVLSQVVLLRLN